MSDKVGSLSRHRSGRMSGGYNMGSVKIESRCCGLPGAFLIVAYWATLSCLPCDWQQLTLAAEAEAVGGGGGGGGGLQLTQVDQLTADCHAHYWQQRPARNWSSPTTRMMKLFRWSFERIQKRVKWGWQVVCFGGISSLLWSTLSSPLSRWSAVCGTISTQLDLSSRRWSSIFFLQRSKPTLTWNQWPWIWNDNLDW